MSERNGGWVDVLWKSLPFASPFLLDLLSGRGPGIEELRDRPDESATAGLKDSHHRDKDRVTLPAWGGGGLCTYSSPLLVLIHQLDLPSMQTGDLALVALQEVIPVVCG